MIVGLCHGCELAQYAARSYRGAAPVDGVRVIYCRATPKPAAAYFAPNPGRCSVRVPGNPKG